jgi:FkbM family methyltransferase
MSLSFSKITSINGWLNNAKDSFLTLLRLIKFNSPRKLIKYQAIAFLSHTIVYPIVRVTQGKIKAANICSSFLNAPSSIIFPLPSPFKSKIAMSRIDPVLYEEIYLKNIYFHELIKERMNVVDIGANIGAYTILAAEKVGKDGKVIAIEPEPKNYNQLLANIKLNNFKNVVPKNIALTDHEGFEKLSLSPYPGKHTILFKEDKVGSIEVPVKTLDNLLEELNLKKIDIVKIDTEGAEIPILKGSEKTLKNNPNMKIIVAAEHYPSEVREVCQFLNIKGFKTKVFSKDTVITV